MRRSSRAGSGLLLASLGLGLTFGCGTSLPCESVRPPELRRTHLLPMLHLTLNFPDGTSLAILFVEDVYVQVTGQWARRPAISWRDDCRSLDGSSSEHLRSRLVSFAEGDGEPDLRHALVVSVEGVVVSSVPAHRAKELDPDFSLALKEAISLAIEKFPRLLDAELISRHPIIQGLDLEDPGSPTG